MNHLYNLNRVEYRCLLYKFSCTDKIRADNLVCDWYETSKPCLLYNSICEKKLSYDLLAKHARCTSLDDDFPFFPYSYCCYLMVLESLQCSYCFYLMVQAGHHPSVSYVFYLLVQTGRQFSFCYVFYLMV